VKSVIPAIKALMAKELVDGHGLKQDKVAEILGVSQSAVSKYSRKVRGYVVRIDGPQEVRSLIDSMVVLLLNGGHQRMEFLQLFCQTCVVVREANLMCPFCAKSDPKVKIDECGFCVSPVSKRKQKGGRAVIV
jgi:predicted transcriptional regulator